MLLSIASFAIAIISLLVSIATFILGNESNKKLRYGLGGFFLLTTLLFGCVGLLSFVNIDNINSSGNSNGEVTNCSFVTTSQIEELKNIQTVASAIKQAEQFSDYKQNDYQEGDLIPANVLIATDLHSTNLQQFDVIPINNQGGWGLFVTTRQLSAPNAGTYWCIK